MSVWDKLSDLDTGTGELARQELARPPLAGEFPEDTAARVQKEKLAIERATLKAEQEAKRAQTEADRQFKAQQRITAGEFAAQGVPTFKDATGAVQPVTDATGAPLTHHDKRHSLAWDALGQPVKIGPVRMPAPSGPPPVRMPTLSQAEVDEFDRTKYPTLSDPYATAPTKTDKQGNVYKVAPGLPWKWEGLDEKIAAEHAQKEKDAEISKTATALRGKLSLDQHARISAGVDFKAASKAFKGVAERNGLLADQFDLDDPVSAHAAIDDHFNALYGAPEANATNGFFSSELSPAAAALRAQYDADKAQAHRSLDTMLLARARHEGAKVREEQSRMQAEAIEREKINAQLVAAGYPPLEAAPLSTTPDVADVGTPEAGAELAVPGIDAPATPQLSGMGDVINRTLITGAHGFTKAVEGLARFVGLEGFAEFLAHRTEKQERALRGEKVDAGGAEPEQFVDPNASGVSKVVGNVAGGLIGAAPGIAMGGIPGLLTIGTQAMAAASAEGFDAAKAEGKSDDEATEVAGLAALKTLPTTLLFAGTGVATNRILRGVLPLEATPITRAAAALVAGTGANIAAISGGRALVGEEAAPTVEDVVNSVIFAAHGSMTQVQIARDLKTARSIIDGTHPEVAIMDGIAEGRVGSATPAQQASAAQYSNAIRAVARKYIEKQGYKAPERETASEAVPFAKEAKGRDVTPETPAGPKGGEPPAAPGAVPSEPPAPRPQSPAGSGTASPGIPGQPGSTTTQGAGSSAEPPPAPLSGQPGIVTQTASAEGAPERDQERGAPPEAPPSEIAPTNPVASGEEVAAELKQREAELAALPANAPPFQRDLIKGRIRELQATLSNLPTAEAANPPVPPTSGAESASTPSAQPQPPSSPEISAEIPAGATAEKAQIETPVKEPPEPKPSEQPPEPPKPPKEAPPAAPPADKTRIVGPALVDAHGKIVARGTVGQSHADLIREAAARGVDATEAVRGFVDEAGSVLDRAQAFQAAQANGQLTEDAAREKGEKPELHSHQLAIKQSPAPSSSAAVESSSGGKAKPKAAGEALSRPSAQVEAPADLGGEPPRVVGEKGVPAEAAPVRQGPQTAGSLSESPAVKKLREKLSEVESELQAAEDATKAGFADEDTPAEIASLRKRSQALRQKIAGHKEPSAPAPTPATPQAEAATARGAAPSKPESRTAMAGDENYKAELADVRKRREAQGIDFNEDAETLNTPTNEQTTTTNQQKPGAAEEKPDLKADLAKAIEQLPADVFSAALEALTRAVLKAHAEELAALGHAQEPVFAATPAENKSGIATVKGRITVDLQKLDDATRSLTMQQRKEYIEKAIGEEEVNHIGFFQFINESPENAARALQVLKDEPEAVALARAEHPGFNRLDEMQQAAEVVRIIMQGRGGSITEATWKFIKDLLQRLKEILKNLKASTRAVIDEIDARMGKEAPAARHKPSPPAEPVAPLSTRSIDHWRAKVEPILEKYFKAFDAIGRERLENAQIIQPGESATNFLMRTRARKPTWDKSRKIGSTGIEMLSRKDLWPTSDNAGEALRKSMLAAVRAINAAPGYNERWMRAQEAKPNHSSGTDAAEAKTESVHLTAAEQAVKDAAGDLFGAASPEYVADMDTQRQWLDKQAKARGYKSASEFAVKGTSQFVKLAKGWRKTHPITESGTRETFSAAAPQTDTPDFKRWFGNSKAIDAKGRPLVLVHVTDKAFTAFKPGGKNPRESGRAIWLGLPGAAVKNAHHGGGKSLGSRSIPLYAKIENPFVVDDDTRDFAESLYGRNFPHLISEAALNQLRADGHDGVLLYERGEVLSRAEKITEAIVFDAAQVKSAIGNRGTFDPAKPNILHAGTPEQNYDAPIPPEKMAALIPAIVNLAKEAGTPESFAASLKKLGPKAPQFAQALWFFAKGGGTAVGPDRPDWPAVFGGLDRHVVDKPATESVATGSEPTVAKSTALVPSSPQEMAGQKWQPNSVVFAAVSYPDYQPLGILQVPHDGTPEGMARARDEASRQAGEQFGDVSHSGSFSGATDELGRVRFVVSPNGRVSEMGTAEGNYALGDLNAFRDDAMKRILAAKEKGDFEEANRLAQEKIDELEADNDRTRAARDKALTGIKNAKALFARGGSAEELDSRFQRASLAEGRAEYLAHLHKHAEWLAKNVTEREAEQDKWRSLLTKNLNAEGAETQRIAEKSVVEPPNQIQQITAARKEREAAERLAKAPDTSPAKMKVQKAYLLDALDKAISEAKDERAQTWATEEGRADNEMLSAFQRYDSPMQKEKPRTDGYWMSAEEKEAAKESLKAWEAKATEHLRPLFDKYDIADTTTEYSGYLNAEGAMQNARGGTPMAFIDRTAALAEAIAAKDREALHKVEIEVPGDGTFRIINTKDALHAFRKTVEKEFPTKTAAATKLPGSASMRITETAIPALGSPKKAGDLIRIAGMVASTDSTRAVINYVHSNGKQIVATDGRRLALITGKAGGTEKNPVHFEPKTAKTHQLGKDETFPNWQQVVPGESRNEIKGLDTGALMKLVIQAREMTSEKSNSVKLYENLRQAGQPRTLGIRSNTPDVGEFESNIEPGAKLIGAYNPDFLIDAMKMARALGHEEVAFQFDDDRAPLAIVASGMKQVIMPLRISDGWRSVAETKPPEAVEEQPKPDAPTPEKVEAEQFPLLETERSRAPEVTRLRTALEKLQTALDEGRGDPDRIRRQIDTLTERLARLMPAGAQSALTQEERRDIENTTTEEQGRTRAANAAAVTKPPPAGVPNTEDAGAELSYNRRNRVRTGIKWDDIAELNPTLRVKEAQKANVHPRPDYEQLIAGGMNPLTAHLVKQAYDAIAAKPVVSGQPTDDHLKRYIAGVHRVMDGVLKWVNDTEATAAWARTMIPPERGRPVSIIEEMGRPKANMLASVYEGGDWKAHRDELITIGGNKVLAALQPGRSEGVKATKEIAAGWPAKLEAWQKQGLQIVPQADILIREQAQSSGRPPVFFAELKSGRYLKYFDSRDAAEAFKNAFQPFLLVDKHDRLKSQHQTQEEAEEAARALTKRGGKTTVSEKGISVEAAQRTGPARRMEGEDISSDKLRETFGFKGVNFGNWMKGDANKSERQLHLNHAYDSFMDLADILGVPHKAVSLNGMLGVAIGAQGSGGAHAAHFVPGVNEINLTRTSGAGSLAHEWGHALDHYFATQAGLATNPEPFLTEHAMRPAVMDRFMEGKRVPVPTFGEGIRPEIVAKFKAIVAVMNKRSETPEEAKARVEASRERSAKSVEGWLKSIRSDFMSAKVDEAAFDQLAERIRSGDLGDGKVAAGNRYLSPVVDELRALYKAKTGRTYSLDQIKGLQGNVDHAAYLRSEAAQEKVHVPQQVGTDYAREALKLDQEKGGKPYWSTDLEKFARAFDAFVSDKIEAETQKNTYLSHGGRTGETVPQGREREAINRAFQALVDAVEHKQTEQGVALYAAAPELARPMLKAAVARTNAAFGSAPETISAAAPEGSDEARLRAAYKTVQARDKWGFPDIAIADLMAEAGITDVAEGHRMLNELRRAGKIQLGGGDASLSTPEVKKWGLAVGHDPRPLLLMHFEPETFGAAAPETGDSVADDLGLTGEPEPPMEPPSGNAPGGQNPAWQWDRKIDAIWKRILHGGRWFWEGTADTLRRAKFTALADATIRQFEATAREFGKTWMPLRSALAPLSRAEARTAKAEWAEFFRHRENGRDADAQAAYAQASAGGKALIDAWKSVAQETGRTLQATGVQVKDGNKWRLIGHLGEKFFPRKINQATLDVLKNPSADPAKWQQLVNDLIANGNIKDASEADRFLREQVFREDYDNDFYANIERARKAKLPESWLEYGFDQIAPWYATHYARRIGQIEAYGQSTDTTQDLWDKELATVPKTAEYLYTQEFLSAARDAAYWRRLNTTQANALRKLQTIATTTFLSNPYSAMRNLVGGVTQTAVQYGPVETLRAVYTAMTSAAARMSAHEKGIMRDDFMAMFMEGRDDLAVPRMMAKAANIGLTATGFNLAEQINRVSSMVAAQNFARWAAAKINADPDSKASMQARAFLQRHGIDPSKIAQENGTGPETDTFVRQSVKQGQGGYTFDQTPLWQSHPIAAFLTQFQKWGAMMTRFLVKHTINPAVFGTKVKDAQGREHTVRSLRPFLYAMALAVLGGELLWLLKELFTDRERGEASLEEIGKSPDAEARRKLLERIAGDIIMSGTFGMLTDYGANLREFTTRGRWKNPFDPPGTQFLKAMFDGIVTLKQQGKLTDDDLWRLLEKQFPGVKFATATGENWTGNTKRAADNTVTLARNAGMRMAKELGLPVQASLNAAIPLRTPRTPFYHDISEALLTGNATRAKALFLAEFKATPPADRKKFVTGLKASITQRQPVSVGGFESADLRTQFFAWAKTRLPADDLQRIQALDRTYWQTAQRAGLVSSMPVAKKPSATAVVASRPVSNRNAAVKPSPVLAGSVWDRL